MTTPIDTAKLRDWCPHDHPCEASKACCTFCSAADELDALRAENERLRARLAQVEETHPPEGYPGIAHDMETLRAENAKLHDAYLGQMQRANDLFVECERLRAALEFYADEGTYHGCGFMFDRPTGGFDEDFDERDDSDYNRPMPGKLARAALAGNPALEGQA